MRLLFLVLLSLPSFAQPWVGILDPNRAVDWSYSGYTDATGHAAAIPNRTTICTTLNPGATGAAINSALSSCGTTAANTGTPQVVLLSAGTYNIGDAAISINKSNVTLRGAGANQTFVVFGSGATTGCEYSGASVCISNGNGDVTFTSGTNSAANLTVAPAKGATQLTLAAPSAASCSTGGCASASGAPNSLKVGTQLILVQDNDSSDNGGVYNCTTTGACIQEGVTLPNQVQRENLIVTAVSGSCSSGCTVTVDTPIKHPNWSLARTVRVWWAGLSGSSNATPLSGVSIENISMEGSATTNAYALVQVAAVINSWIINSRFIRHPASVASASDKIIDWWSVKHITLRNNYIVGQIGMDDYCIHPNMWSDNNLIENNIMQNCPSGFVVTESEGSGNVIAYNYQGPNFWNNTASIGSSQWGQPFFNTHTPASNFNLMEGNVGHSANNDNTKGLSYFNVWFRGYYRGLNYQENNQTPAAMIYAYERFSSLIGNVLGTSGYHNQYQTVATSSSGSSGGSCNTSIYALGLGGNCANGGGGNPPNDTIAANCLMRWGNWDVVNGASRFVSSEVPSSGCAYNNAVPGSQTLPASFYLAAAPNWWKVSTASGTLCASGCTPNWPAIGPDVTCGNCSLDMNLGTLGNHVDKIPAQLCYESCAVDTNYGAASSVTATSYSNGVATVTVGSSVSVQPYRDYINVSGVGSNYDCNMCLVVSSSGSQIGYLPNAVPSGNHTGNMRAPARLNFDPAAVYLNGGGQGGGSGLLPPGGVILSAR